MILYAQEVLTHFIYQVTILNGERLLGHIVHVTSYWLIYIQSAIINLTLTFNALQTDDLYTTAGSDPIYVVIYYIKWVTISWIYSR